MHQWPRSHFLLTLLRLKPVGNRAATGRWSARRCSSCCTTRRPRTASNSFGAGPARRGHHTQALAISRKIRNRHGEGTHLGSLWHSVLQPQCVRQGHRAPRPGARGSRLRATTGQPEAFLRAALRRHEAMWRISCCSVCMTTKELVYKRAMALEGLHIHTRKKCHGVR